MKEYKYSSMFLNVRTLYKNNGSGNPATDDDTFVYVPIIFWGWWDHQVSTCWLVLFKIISNSNLFATVFTL